jgi:hypothetical protein
MVVIGKIKISREIKKRLLPPVYEPIVKGPTFTPVVEAPLYSHAPPTLMPGGGGGAGGPPGAKAVHVVLSESVTVGGGSVNRTVTLGPGVGPTSYTSLSYTFSSYTIAGVSATKTLVETVDITEPLSVQRAKTRVLFDVVPDNSESSETVNIQTTKARALAETDAIAELLTLETTIAKSLIETDAISEAVAIQHEKRRVLAAEDVGIEDILERARPTILAPLEDTEIITDAVAITVTYATGTHVTKSLTETETIADAVTAVKAKTRALEAETITVLESLTKETTTQFVSFTATSFTTISFTTEGEARRVERAIVETEEISDAVRIQTSKNRGLTEIVHIIDTQANSNNISLDESTLLGL